MEKKNDAACSNKNNQKVVLHMRQPAVLMFTQTWEKYLNNISHFSLHNLLSRSHRKFLTLREIWHHTNHCTSTHLFRSHRKLLALRQIPQHGFKPRITTATQVTRFHTNKPSQHGLKSYICLTQTCFCFTLYISQKVQTNSGFRQEKCRNFSTVL